MPYKIIEEKCSKCGKCDTQCPVDAITEEDNFYFIHDDLCADCGACLDVCKEQAIVKSEYKLSYVETKDDERIA